MNNKRKIEPVIRKVSFADAESIEDEDLMYWSKKPIKERLIEMLEWNKKVWMNINGSYPAKIEVTGGKRLKSNTDEDDF